MKIMAVGPLPAPLSLEQVGQFMPNEVPATLRLYLDGHMEQFCAAKMRWGFSS